MSMDEPRPDPRPARRRDRPDLPAPRVRDRAEREPHRRAVLAALDALGDGQLRGREDEQVARQPRVRERPAEDCRPARDPPRAHAPPLPRRVRVVRHRSRRGHRAAAPPARAAEAATAPDPRPFADRVRAALDDDLDAPKALEALDDLASAILSGGDDATAPGVLRELGALLGVDLDAGPPTKSPLTWPGARSPLVPSPLHGRSITITLPDGSHARVRQRAPPPARSRRRSARGLAKAAVAAKVDGEWVDLDRPIDHDAAVSIVTADTRRRSRGAAALDRARDGAGRHRPLPGRASTRSARPSPTASTTTSSCPTAPHFTEDDLERIEARMREIVTADQPFERDEVNRDEGLAVFADQPYKRDIIEKVDPDAGEVGEGSVDLAVPEPPARRRRRSSTCAAVRTCRRRSGSARSSSRRSPARTGAATRTRRCSSASTAPRGSRRRRSTSTCTASRKPRGATTASSALELDLFSFPEEIGSGLAVFHPKGGLVRKIMEDYSRAASRGRAATSS